MEQSNRRVLGADRNLADIIPVIDGSSTSHYGGSNIPAPSRNSIYRAGDDISILLDEVLNNDISAVFIYDDFESFSDVDLYSLSIVMRKNTSILAITMSGVDIGDEIFGTFCEAMLNSNVQYIDLCNTPLDEEAGRSIAGLAHNNTNLRTVIVEDTLISDEALDEVDLACLFNESTAVELLQKREREAAAFKQATTTTTETKDAKEVAAAAVAKKESAPRLCVANEFNSCPHGASCLFAHGPTSAGSEKNGVLTTAEVAQRRKGWEKLLQGDDEEEASYSRSRNIKLNEGGDTSEEKVKKPALKFTLNKPATAATSTPPVKGNGSSSSASRTTIAVLGGGVIAVVAVAFIVAASLKRGSQKQ